MMYLAECVQYGDTVHTPQRSGADRATSLPRRAGLRPGQWWPAARGCRRYTFTSPLSSTARHRRGRLCRRHAVVHRCYSMSC